MFPLSWDAHGDTGLIHPPGARVMASVRPHPHDLGGGRRVHRTTAEACDTG